MTDECIQIRCVTTTTEITTISSREDTATTTTTTTGITTTTNGDKPDALVLGRENENAVGVGGADGGAKSFATQKYIAHMPTERYATDYNMNHKNRGLALIFNHEFFDIPNLKSRAGTNVDCENLTKAFKNLDFEVKIYKDYKLNDIMNAVKQAASIDHSDNDCISIAVLSHGEHGYLYARDFQYKLDSIWCFLTAHNCPTLAGKPKLFFIQACRGEGVDNGILMQKTETDGESSMSYKIPVHADFLIAYSTISGYYSWRNPTNGSWFIQALVQELNTNGKKT